MEMSFDLFNCKPWNYEPIVTAKRKIEVCVSPPQYGNETKTLVQFHIAVAVDGQMLALGFTNKDKYQSLEIAIRSAVNENTIFQAAGLDNRVINIWYYNIAAYEGKALVPCRLAVTINRLSSTASIDMEKLRCSILNAVFKWVDELDESEKFLKGCDGCNEA